MARKSSSLTPGRTYFGPHEARRLLLSVEGDTVTFQHFLSMRTEQCSVDEMLAFAAGSKRRTYIRDHGTAERDGGRYEKRIKLGVVPDDAKDPDGGPDSHAGMIKFLDNDGKPQFAAPGEWAKWRAAVPA